MQKNSLLLRCIRTDFALLSSMNGCKGAWLHAYTDWFAKNGGISPHEGSYPYLDKYPNLNCSKAGYVKKWNSGAKVLRSIQDWRCNEDKLKKMVYENGAVLVGLYLLMMVLLTMMDVVFSSSALKVKSQTMLYW